jgi:hypothetical protein
MQLSRKPIPSLTQKFDQVLMKTKVEGGKYEWNGQNDQENNNNSNPPWPFVFPNIVNNQ